MSFCCFKSIHPRVSEKHIKDQKFIDCTYLLCLCLVICLTMALRFTFGSKGHSIRILLSPFSYFDIRRMLSGRGIDIPPFFPSLLMKSNCLSYSLGRFVFNTSKTLYSPKNMNFTPSK